MSLEETLLTIIAAAGFMTAAIAWLRWRDRYGLPFIIATVTGSVFESDGEKTEGRTVLIAQPIEPPTWLVYEIKLRHGRQKWLARVGEDVRDSFGGVVGQSQGSDWTRSIKVNPPTERYLLLLHPSAPAHLWLSVGIMLRTNPRIKRTVVVGCR